jgi:hypothetical protein
MTLVSVSEEGQFRVHNDSQQIHFDLLACRTNITERSSE